MGFDVLSFALGRNSAKGGGEGSAAGVHFVTFMNEDGTAELYKRPVADGDDCADPVIREYISEPTKESTAQYNYTHVGWSASPNGALDENILKAVTADKTVYANFAAVIRYYTVTYYDSDGTTVLKTESLAYGTTPSYKPTKEGYTFDGWIPAVAAVTGDVTYTVKWTEKITFANSEWADIARVCEAGEASSYFKVGDRRTITCGSTTLTACIIGIGHDDLADGSGKAGITVMTLTPYSSVTWYDSSQSYPNSPVQTGLNGMLSNFESGLRSVVKTVSKDYDSKKDSANVASSDIVTADLKIWAPSIKELGTDKIYFVNTSYTGRIADLGSTYSYIKNNVKSLYNGGLDDFWTRNHVRFSSAFNGIYINEWNGDNFKGSYSNSAMGLIAVFCI